jgi:hypothetical protein
VRKSLRGGDSESDSKGDSEGGKKLFFQGALQGFRGATRTLVSRFAHVQVLSLKQLGVIDPSIMERSIIMELSADGPCIRDKNGDCR